MLTNLLLILAVSLWGLSFIATKISLQYLTPVEIITVRLILGTPVLAAILLWKKVPFRFSRRDVVILVMAAIVLGAHFLIQNLGLIYTSATNTAWLIATVPAFVVVLSRIFLKERFNIFKILGIGLGTVGVILLVSKGEIGRMEWLKSKGDWIILSTCVTWAIYTIITRNITRRYHPLAVSLAVLLPPLVILSLITGAITPAGKFFDLPGQVIGALLFLGIACLGLAHWFWMEGLSRKGASEVGAFLYLEPIVTTIAATFMLEERITLLLAFSASLIILGVYLVGRRPVPVK